MAIKCIKENVNNEIADSIYNLSKAVRLLGNGNIERGDLSPGAMEGFAIIFRDSAEKVASSIDGVAESLNNIADALIQKLSDRQH